MSAHAEPPSTGSVAVAGDASSVVGTVELTVTSLTAASLLF
jgi:hypothetical protein